MSGTRFAMIGAAQTRSAGARSELRHLRGSGVDGGLARALLLDQLRMARWLSADADPLTDEIRARIARDLRTIARRTGVPLVRSRS
jgi:hypothetical protein